MKKIFCFITALFFACPGYAQVKDTLHIFFPLDQSNLSPESTLFIDSLLHKKMLAPGRKMVILGYGDYLGSDGYNENLSYARAKNVLDYLILKDFRKEDIKLCVGKGKINRLSTNGNKGNSKDRKVELIIDKIYDTTETQRFEYALTGLKENETYPLYNIHFYQGRLDITPSSLPHIKMLYDFLNAHKSYIIQLEGHVCCLGRVEGVDEPYDESTLSQKRADLVCDSMVKYGIEKPHQMHRPRQPQPHPR